MARCDRPDVDTVGGVRFNNVGNVVGKVYLRKVKDGRLVNSVFQAYPDVSQFWTYGGKPFLANPVYSRELPPAKYRERHYKLSARAKTPSKQKAACSPARCSRLSSDMRSTNHELWN